MTRAMIRSIRPSLGGSNGRITTRLLFGLRTIPVRRTRGDRRAAAGAAGRAGAARDAAIAVRPAERGRGPRRRWPRARSLTSVRSLPWSLAPDLGVRRIIGRGIGRDQSGGRFRAPRPAAIHVILRLSEGGRRALHQLHLAQRQQEGEGRLGPLVEVDAVLLEAVAAAAGLGVVEVQPQVVAAQEPLEGEPGLLEPGGVVGGVVGLEAGRDRGMGLDRLLIELGPLAAAAVEAVAADRPEAARRRLLLVDQPSQGLEPDLRRPRAPARSAGGDQGVRQPGVVVGQDVLEPGPVVVRGPVEQLDQPVAQRVAHLAGRPRPAEPVEVQADAQQRRGPPSGRDHLGGRRQRLVEELRGPELQVPPPRTAHARPQRPERPAIAVVGPDLLQPGAVEAHEVAEPPLRPVEGVIQERGVGRRQPVDLPRALAELLQEHGQQERPGVVVGAVPLGEMGDRRAGVLEQPGRVGHPHQVVEPPAGQVHRLLGQRAHGLRLVGDVQPAPPRPGERLHVEVGDVAPDHLPAQHVGLLAHRVPPRLVAQQVDDLARQRRRVAEGDQHPAAVGQQLLGVPVRRREHRLAAAERVRQGPRDDLRRVQVGRDVDVRHADELDQLVDLQEAVVEAHVGLDAQVLGQPLQADPVPLPLLAEQVRVRRPHHDVDEVGELPEDRRHRPEHHLDPLVGREQAEGQRRRTSPRRRTGPCRSWGRRTACRGCRGRSGRSCPPGRRRRRGGTSGPARTSPPAGPTARRPGRAPGAARRSARGARCAAS